MKKYTLSCRAPFTSRWSKTQHEALFDAMFAAWRKHNKGYSVDNITHEHEVSISGDVMAQALNEIDNLVRETPGRQVSEIIEQIVVEQIMQGITNPELEAG